mmetsp:Transcript_896/g.1491  ORF Transcript_896/g.1491 Transcript_896/m.1491 type:complete len:88 (-) Transcript_896:74-337(-)
MRGHHNAGSTSAQSLLVLSSSALGKRPADSESEGSSVRVSPRKLGPPGKEASESDESEPADGSESEDGGEKESERCGASPHKPLDIS